MILENSYFEANISNLKVYHRMSRPSTYSKGVGSKSHRRALEEGHTSLVDKFLGRKYMGGLHESYNRWGKSIYEESLFYMEEDLALDFKGSSGSIFNLTHHGELLIKRVKVEVLSYRCYRPVDLTAALNDYMSPESVAGRIVDFIKALYGLYLMQNGGDESREKFEEFFQMILEGVERGFREARALLGLIPDSVNSLIDETYNKVMEYLSAWREEMVK